MQGPLSARWMTCTRDYEREGDRREADRFNLFAEPESQAVWMT